MVCLRNIFINTPYKGDNDDDNNKSVIINKNMSVNRRSIAGDTDLIKKEVEKI